MTVHDTLYSPIRAAETTSPEDQPVTIVVQDIGAPVPGNLQQHLDANRQQWQAIGQPWGSLSTSSQPISLGNFPPLNIAMNNYFWGLASPNAAMRGGQNSNN